MFRTLSSSIICLFLIAFTIQLTACSPQQYQLNTHLKRNGITLGPSKVTLSSGVPKEYQLPLSEANELRYMLLEHSDGSIALQAELIKLTSDTESITPLPGFTLLADGEEAELEFQLDDNQPHYRWKVSITPF